MHYDVFHKVFFFTIFRKEQFAMTSALPGDQELQEFLGRVLGNLQIKLLRGLVLGSAFGTPKFVRKIFL